MEFTKREVLCVASHKEVGLRFQGARKEFIVFRVILDRIDRCPGADPKRVFLEPSQDPLYAGLVKILEAVSREHIPILGKDLLAQAKLELALQEKSNNQGGISLLPMEG
jgi:hypothetical protein